MGSLTSSFSRYFNWRGKDFSASTSNIFKDLIKPENLINLATNFTFYTSENINSKKIIAGYHQFYGVNKAKNKILKAMENNKKGGIFWHTQGSGKSYSMIFLTRIVSSLKPGTTFVVITDRNDLDDQLYHNFMLAKNYVAQKIQKIPTIKELKSELKNRNQDGIFFSTIQKFTADVGKLIDRDNVVVISDEAHRSHYNIEGEIKIDIDSKSYLKKFGSAKYLRDAFPNATFIGFTGTPIEKSDRSTQRIFGNIISSYTMSEAERDGVIVEINYESRKASMHFDESKLKLLDQEYAEINEKLKINSILPGEVMKKINKAMKRLNNFISDSNRIYGICEDFLKHYNSRKNLVAGKAMIVTLNRKVALKYYEKIIELSPQLKNNIKLIFTANAQSDSFKMIELAGTSQSRKNLGEEFKRENSDLKIVIVVNMWLTGFDIPVLDTLYLDKPLKMHNLIQTIARTNRVYTNKHKNIVKESGLIVDYIGIWKRLKEALAFYANKNKMEIEAVHDLQIFKVGSLRNLNLIYKNFGINKLNINIEKCFQDQNYGFDIIEKIANQVLSNKKQNEFVDSSRALIPIFKKIISILTNEEQIRFFLIFSSRQKLIKIALDDVDFIGIKEKLLYQLDNALEFTKTVVVDKLKNKKINLNDLMNFFDKNTNEKTDLSARKNISALKLMLNELKRIDITKSSKLSKDLRELLKKYDNNFITLEDLIEGLSIISSETINGINSNEDDGFTNEERNFYKIIEDPIKQTDYDREKIKIILKELLQIINNDKLVNKQWFYNNVLRRKTRGSIKRLLKKHNYPPDKSEFARNEIIDGILYYKEIKNEKNG